MRRFAMRLALRASGWFAEKLFDLAEAIDAMDNRPPPPPSAPVVVTPAPAKKAAKPVVKHCYYCGVVPRFGVCACGLAPGLAQRFAAGGAC